VRISGSQVSEDHAHLEAHSEVAEIRRDLLEVPHQLVLGVDAELEPLDPIYEVGEGLAAEKPCSVISSVNVVIRVRGESAARRTRAGEPRDVHRRNTFS
jgi:hypothetical protein